jgi:hypothetical protein
MTREDIARCLPGHQWWVMGHWFSVMSFFGSWQQPAPRETAMLTAAPANAVVRDLTTVQTTLKCEAGYK